MRTEDIAVASIATTPVAVIAGKCADRIAEIIGTVAVTLDPEGRVCVEDPDSAAESDIVGVYRFEPGCGLALTRNIRDDLLHEKKARGIVPKARRRQVINDGWMRQRKKAANA